MKKIFKLTKLQQSKFDQIAAQIKELQVRATLEAQAIADFHGYDIDQSGIWQRISSNEIEADVIERQNEG